MCGICVYVEEGRITIAVAGPARSMCIKPLSLEMIHSFLEIGFLSKFCLEDIFSRWNSSELDKMDNRVGQDGIIIWRDGWGFGLFSKGIEKGKGQS